MTKRLRVSKVRGEKFGRFGDRNVDLGDHDFVVVLGDNETGKSTLAEMVAWILAGRRSDSALGRRLVNFLTTNNTQAEIGGVLLGTLGKESFDVRRNFIIRKSSSGRQREDPQAIVRVSDSDISGAEWQSLTAIKNGDDYFYRFRIIAGGPETTVGHMELIEAISAGVNTRKTPREITEALDGKGRKYCAKSNGQTISTSKYAESLEKLEGADKRKLEIYEAVAKVNTSEHQLRDKEEVIRQTNHELDRCLERKSQVESATQAVVLKRNVVLARERLAEKPKPEDYKWHVEAAYNEIAARIAALKSDEESRLLAEGDLNSSALKADLRPESLDRIRMGTDENEEVKRLAADLRKVEEKRETCSKRKKELDKQRSEAIGVLSNMAPMLNSTVDHLKQIGLMTLDDASFGDPLRQWSERAGALATAESRLSELNAKCDSAVRAHEDAKKAWDKLDQTITPMEAVANSGTSQVTQARVGIPKLAYAAIFAVTVVGSFVDGRLGALLGLAGVVLAVVDVGRAQWRTRDSISSAGRGVVANHIASAAKRFNDADSKLEQVKGQVETAVGMRDNAKSELEVARQHAVEVLKKFGFAATTDPLDAVRIRAEREQIRDAASELADADRGLVDNADEDQRLAVSDADLREKLRVLAETIGLSEGPSELSVPHAQLVLDAKRAHDRYRSAEERADISRAELAQVAGSWVHELPVERVEAQFQEICDAVKRYRSLEDDARTKADELKLLAPTGSEVLKIISEPMFDEASGERELKALQEKIRAINVRITDENQGIGRIQKELETLASEDDLPKVAMEVAKHSELVCNAVLYGGAYYLAAKIVQDIKSEVEQKSQPELVKEATVIAKRVTAGDWGALLIPSESPNEMVITQGFERFGQDALSMGAIDALKLCIRLAAARLHAKSTGVALPLILDDPSGSIDANRMSKVLVELQTISKEHQVIVLTHNSKTAEQIANLGGHVVNMPDFAGSAKVQQQ